MLTKFRTHHIKTTLWIILIIIIPSFIFWGVSFFISGKKQNTVITVAGKPMSSYEFNKYLTMAKIYYRITMGENFYAEINQNTIRSTAFQFILLLKKAKEDKIRASDKDVIKTIESKFSINGKFEEEIYKRYTQEIMMTPREFEEYIRKILTADMVLNKYVRNVTVKESEIEKIYKIDNEQAKVSYIYIPYQKPISSIPPAKNSKKPSSHSKNVFNRTGITNKEIKDYYSKHKDDFSTPRKIKIKYIVLNKDRNKAVINKILRHIRNTKSVYYLIKKSSLKFQETGFFDINHPPAKIKRDKKVIELAFSMPEGKLSPLIEEGESYILFEKTGHKKKIIPVLNKVEGKIIEILQNKKRKSKAEAKAKRVIKDVLSNKTTLSALAKNYSLKYALTKYLTRQGLEIKMGITQNICDAIFRLKNGSIYPHPITATKGIYIVKLKEFLPIDKNKFNKEKESYRRRLLFQKMSLKEISFFSQLERETPIRILRRY